MGFSLVQADLGATLHVGVQQPFNDEQRPFDPSDFAQCDRELVLSGVTVPFIGLCLTLCGAAILRGREADPLPAWIDDAIETDLAPIVRFARTLNRDFDAVKNAIEMPWSNGQAEGQINRLKTLKRAMYGRAGPELSRARMLPFRHTD